VKSESKFWQEVKAKLGPHFVLTRTDLINISGWPDVVLYNKNGTFLTIELKVAQSNSVRLSAHQIGFHILHPKNTFILVKPLAASLSKLSDEKLSEPYLYKGSSVQELAARGLRLEPFIKGWLAIIEHLANI
jgi:hypothetical protein